MSTRRQYKKSKPSEPMYVVISREGQIYVGLKGGSSQWSYNWDEAKPLYEESTSWLLKTHPGAEIINQEEI
jgi:hypothetical protein